MIGMRHLDALNIDPRLRGALDCIAYCPCPAREDVSGNRRVDVGSACVDIR